MRERAGYDGPGGRAGFGGSWGLVSGNSSVSIRSLDGAAAIAMGLAQSGELGPTKISLLLWHSLIESWPVVASLWSEQWHVVGSGQQHSTFTEITRSCDTGTAIIAITATIIENSAWATRRFDLERASASIARASAHVRKLVPSR